MLQATDPQDLDSLTPTRDFNRRDFVRTTVGSGFAAATLPICAQTVIKTDAAGLTAGTVSIDVKGFKMPAYRAAPACKTRLPVVLMVSEIFGVRVGDVTHYPPGAVIQALHAGVGLVHDLGVDDLIDVGGAGQPVRHAERLEHLWATLPKREALPSGRDGTRTPPTTTDVTAT